MLDPAKVQEGDVLIGLASSGIHSNGYSLVRKVVTDGKTLYELRMPQESLGGQSVLDALLEPTRIYVKPVRSVLRQLPGAVRSPGSHYGWRHYRELESCASRKHGRRAPCGNVEHASGYPVRVPCSSS